MPVTLQPIRCLGFLKHRVTIGLNLKCVKHTHLAASSVANSAPLWIHWAFALACQLSHVNYDSSTLCQYDTHKHFKLYKLPFLFPRDSCFYLFHNKQCSPKSLQKFQPFKVQSLLTDLYNKKLYANIGVTKGKSVLEDSHIKSKPKPTAPVPAPGAANVIWAPKAMGVPISPSLPQHT